MVDFPKLKKKVGDFLSKEDGKISKESLIKTGIILAFVGIAQLKDSNAFGAGESYGCGTCTGGSYKTHCNDLAVGYAQTTASAAGSHNHHANHCSHSSHGSHSSSF